VWSATVGEQNVGQRTGVAGTKLNSFGYGLSTASLHHGISTFGEMLVRYNAQATSAYSLSIGTPSCGPLRYSDPAFFLVRPTFAELAPGMPASIHCQKCLKSDQITGVEHIFPVKIRFREENRNNAKFRASGRVPSPTPFGKVPAETRNKKARTPEMALANPRIPW
jgi:hypothetical protein